jgi:hypothetical protein
MILSPEEIEGLWHRSPHFEAWILSSSANQATAEASLLHFGGGAH